MAKSSSSPQPDGLVDGDRQQALLQGLEPAWQARALLRSQLASEGTDCLRLLHGSREGLAGVTVDAYGPLLLVQWTIHSGGQPEDNADWSAVEGWARDHGFSHWLVVGRHGHASCRWAGSNWDEPLVTREFGLEYPLDFHRLRLDPQLFLDTRCLRRHLGQHHDWGVVANLFCYSNSLGLAAELRGQASEVWAVDFSRGNLEVARRFHERNGAARQNYLCEETYPVLWQWAGRRLPALKGRRAPLAVAPRQFDTVIVDPPQYSRGRFGAVDIKNDYPSLIRPCCEILRAGGRLLALNNLADVGWTPFESMLRRSAEKSGRQVLELQRILPDSDFPARDDDPALKIAIMRLE